jgi:hypothetical protein
MTPRSLRWWIRQLHKVWQCSWGDRWLLMQAVSGLGVARLAVLTLPLRWIAPFLGHYMQESPATDRPAQQTMVMRVSWAVCTMSRYTPWESTCLAQAIAAKRMLQRLQIPSTLYLGVARNDAGGVEAHAWLRSGKRVVTGAPGMARFTTVGTFAEGGEVTGHHIARVTMRRWLQRSGHQ